MGAQVYAIEEVCNYVDCVNYIKNAFAIDNLQIESRSLFSLDSHEFIDRFDIVLYSGVIYHVSDPILSLRIVFNSLKDGGLCLLETRGIEGKRKYLAYGERIQRENRKSLVSSTLLGGWAWFIPSLESLIAMMKDVGFQVHKATFHNGNRILAIGLRNQHVDMLRAGLSKPNIR
jgi:SAM-dependent methyltransferase